MPFNPSIIFCLIYCMKYELLKNIFISINSFFYLISRYFNLWKPSCEKLLYVGRGIFHRNNIIKLRLKINKKFNL